MNSLFQNFIQLFFPQLCLMCQAVLVQNERSFCTGCLSDLPLTNYHLHPDNPVSQKFYGFVPVDRVTAMYRFHKYGKVQHMLHQLKYGGKQIIGTLLGRRYGPLLKAAHWNIDCVVPVPLHEDRLRIRGYNQCQTFAEALAETLSAQVDSTSLLRKKVTETQVEKSKWNRWDNLTGAFQVTKSTRLKGKNVLLVDDVITTGATLITCAQALAKAQVKTINIASIAVAE